MTTAASAASAPTTLTTILAVGDIADGPSFSIALDVTPPETDLAFVADANCELANAQLKMDVLCKGLGVSTAVDGGGSRDVQVVEVE